jgi:transposase InsO family protein
MCHLYGVTRAGYYAWRSRGTSSRDQEDSALLSRIRTVFDLHEGRYGSPRVHGALRRSGVRTGSKRVARLMRGAQLRGKVARLYRSRPLHRAFFAALPNRQLNALADGPDRVWVADVTYLKVGDRWQYLAVVLDKWSRRLIGWALGARRDVALTLRALGRALQHRRPRPGVVFHTDRGIEYAAHPFRDRLRQLGFVQSMNRPRRMNDNAHMESFFHSMKSDLHPRLHTRHRSTLERAIAWYERYYNERRDHTSLGCTSPAAFEAARC